MSTHEPKPLSNHFNRRHARLSVTASIFIVSKVAEDGVLLEETQAGASRTGEEQAERVKKGTVDRELRPLKTRDFVRRIVRPE